AFAAGYKRTSMPLLVPPSGSEEPRVHLVLPVDRGYSPPAPKEQPVEPPSFLKGRPFVNLFGGYAWSPTLHAYPPCPRACDSSANGALVGFRGGYRLGFGLAFEVAGGYMTVGSKLSSLGGLFPALGISYQVLPVRWLGLLARMTVGLIG